jgi:DNA polymerase (family 10)
VDNRSLARVFAQIADLLEVKGENAFKIRAYRGAAETIGDYPDAVAKLDAVQLRELPGIGKDLAAKIRELVDTGDCAYHRELLQEFPPTILEMLRLQGIGPKTVALIYGTLGIASVDALAVAAREGRLRSIKGMGPKKETLILKAIEERQKDTGRALLPRAAALSEELLHYLRARVPGTEFIAVGSLRRGCETCGDLDILAVGAHADVMDVFVQYPGVERVLARGDSKSSIRLAGGLQADLRMVPLESRGAAMQYFTGSKMHNIALRDLAIQRNFKLNEYGLFTIETDARVAGETEASIYEALGLSLIDPALREDRGEIAAAAQRQLPRLITDQDLRGDLHMHTTETDGRDALETMAAAAQARGHQYIAITEHSRALAMANGLDETRALAHAARVRALNGRFAGLTLLAGIECDILADGRLDLADDCLAQLDIVIASVHSQMTQEPAQITDRLLRAMECPWVDVLGHPTARRLLRRDGMRYDFDAVTASAAQRGVAMEINCQIERLDLGDTQARMARDRGVRLVISTDAHSTLELQNQHWGVQTARRGWITSADVLNTLDVQEMRASLRRNARTPGSLGPGGH